MNNFELFNGDCLEIMKNISDKSIDMVLCDLPYGVISQKWDSIIPFNDYVIIKNKIMYMNDYLIYSYKHSIDIDSAIKYWNENYNSGLWNEYNRIIKDNGVVLLFSSGNFTNTVINSNLKNFKYKLIWKKNVPTGMVSASYRPMKYYEEVCVFSKSKGTYNPIMKKRVGEKKSCYNAEHYCSSNNHIPNNIDKIKKKYNPDYVQPSDIIEFDVVPNRKKKYHPTQKPVALLEYLVNTYTNENDIVLDNCMGSGSTAIACINTNRDFIGIELDSTYFDICQDRIKNSDKYNNIEMRIHKCSK